MRESIRLWFVAAALVAASACSTTPVNPRYAHLPTGVTLLDTDTGGRCDGTMRVREEQRGKARDTELVLRPGENATFDVDVRDGDHLQWSCLGDTRTVSRSAECPDTTSYVRILRTADTGGITLECYGSRRNL